MNYCGKHCLDHESVLCPRCEVEERAEEHHNELLDAIYASNERRANPGDYQCPQCSYHSLRWGASRCPLCQGKVSADHWAELQAQEERRDANSKRLREEERLRDNVKRILAEVEPVGVDYMSQGAGAIIGAIVFGVACIFYYPFYSPNSLNSFLIGCGFGYPLSFIGICIVRFIRIKNENVRRANAKERLRQFEPWLFK